MTVNTPIPFSRSNILPIGAPSPRNDQEAVPVPMHSMAHTTRHLDIGGLRTNTILFWGALLFSPASHSHHRHPHQDILSRRNSGRGDDPNDVRLRPLIQLYAAHVVMRLSVHHLGQAFDRQ